MNNEKIWKYIINNIHFKLSNQMVVKNSSSEYLDFTDDQSLSIYDIDEYVEQYKLISDELDNYILINNLDNILDLKDIIKELPEISSYLKSDQAVLIDIEDFVLIKMVEYLEEGSKASLKK